MQLTVNGKTRTVPSESTILSLLEESGIDPRIVAVELNGDIVRRVRWAETALSEGDTLEIVRMVGGG